MAVALYVNKSRQLPNSKLMLSCLEDDGPQQVKFKAFNKQSAFNPHIINRLSDNINDFKLIYRSGKEVDYIPQSNVEFTVKRYREATGLSYQSLQFGLLFCEY